MPPAPQQVALPAGPSTKVFVTGSLTEPETRRLGGRCSQHCHEHICELLALTLVCLISIKTFARTGNPSELHVAKAPATAFSVVFFPGQSHSLDTSLGAGHLSPPRFGDTGHIITTAQSPSPSSKSLQLFLDRPPPRASLEPTSGA